MLRLTTVLLLLSPAIASAQCLTAADLDTGIMVEYGNGNSSNIQRLADGTLRDAYTDFNSYTEETILFESLNGVFQTAQTVHEKGKWAPRSTLTMTYDFSTAALTRFTPDYAGYGRQTTANERRGDRQSAFGWQVFASDPLVVGDCSYDALRIFTTTFDPRRAEVYVREIKYLPGLGFGLQLGNSYFGWSADNATIVSMSGS